MTLHSTTHSPKDSETSRRSFELVSTGHTPEDDCENRRSKDELQLNSTQ